METAEPMLQRRAVEEGQKAAGGAEIKRDAQGNLVKIERPEGRGVLFNQAFDKVAQARYVNQVSYDFQNFLNTEVNDRRTGKDGKVFDPDQFDAVVQGRIEGMLKTVDPELKPAVEDVVFREALERTRSFRDEWGRTQQAQAISGSKDQLNQLLNGFNAENINRLGYDKAWETYGAPAERLIQEMRNAQQIGPEEFEGLLMRVDELVESGEGYVLGMATVTEAAPIIAGLSDSDLDAADNYLNGVNSGEITGVTTTVRGGTGDIYNAMVQVESRGQQFDKNGRPLTSPKGAVGIAQVMEATGPEAAKLAGVEWDRDKWLNDRDYNLKIGRAYYEMLLRRYDGDGLKAAAAYNGGMRRVDAAVRQDNLNWAKSSILPAETRNYVVEVTKRVNASQSTEVNENPKAKQMTFETLSQLDPSAKQAMSRLISRRRQEIGEEEAIARAQAADARRAQEESDKLNRIINVLDGNLRNGVGGDHDAETRGVLNGSFENTFDMSRVNQIDEQKRMLQWVQRNMYVPPTLINYMENAAVSPNWRQATTFYNGMKIATLPTGGVVGDLLLSKLSPRSRAILERSSALINSGESEDVILPFITRMQSGVAYTRDAAVGEYNANLRSKANPQPYDADRRKAVMAAYDLPKGNAIPANLLNLIDESYAANLDLVNKDPKKALELAIEQNKRLYTRSGIFNGGFGPAIVQRTLGGSSAVANQNMLKFLQDMRRNGKPVLPTITGANGKRIPHQVGGPNSTIRLTPLDDNIATIGMYRIDIIHPETKQVIPVRTRFDMGVEIRDWVKTLSTTPPKAKTGQDPIEAARERRAEGGANFRRVKERAQTISGPKI
jgi:soluble lytic murein transglycosylase-like protein